MFWWIEAVEVIEATEVVEPFEVIEAAEVPEARKITQYVKCKVSFSAKMHKKAKNKIENRFTFGTFKLLLLKKWIWIFTSYRGGQHQKNKNWRIRHKWVLSHEYVGPKILAKIKIYVLTRAELLFQVCYEIPCKTKKDNLSQYL